MKMKKMKLFALMFLAGALIFSSCKKDEEEVAVAGPSLVFQNGNNSMEFDGSKGIDVRLDFTAEGEVSSFKLVFSLNNATADSIYELTSTYKGEKSGNYTFTRSAALVGSDLDLDATGTVKYVFTLIDKNNNTKTATYTVTAASTAGPINTYTTVLLGGQDNTTLGSAYDAEGNEVFSMTGITATNQAKVDFIFAYGSTSHYYIGSPSNSDIAISHDMTGWTTKNATVIATTTVTNTEFDAITDDAAIVAATANISGTKANDLNTNDVFAFITVDGKKGLVKVVATEGTSGADRKITLEVKIQQ